MAYDPWGIKVSDPNKGREPFDSKGNENSVPVPNHPDWARKKNGKKRKIVIAKHNQDVNKNG